MFSSYHLQAPWAVLVIFSVVLHRLQVIVIFVCALTGCSAVWTNNIVLSWVIAAAGQIKYQAEPPEQPPWVVWTQTVYCGTSEKSREEKSPTFGLKSFGRSEAEVAGSEVVWWGSAEMKFVKHWPVGVGLGHWIINVLLEPQPLKCVSSEGLCNKWALRQGRGRTGWLCRAGCNLLLFITQIWFVVCCTGTCPQPGGRSVNHPHQIALRVRVFSTYFEAFFFFNVNLIRE